MSYLQLKHEAEIAFYPAYIIARRMLTKGAIINGRRREIEFTEIKSGESLGLPRDSRNGRYFQEFKPGSVVSYALENGDDPIESLEKSKKLCHQLHWLNACGAMLTSAPRKQETWTLIMVGMLVRFEGRLFTIQNAPNQNLKLVPFELPKMKFSDLPMGAKFFDPKTGTDFTKSGPTAAKYPLGDGAMAVGDFASDDIVDVL